MWVIVKELLALLIAIYVITQVIIPCFSSDIPFFNLHKKDKKTTPTKRVITTLEELDKEAEDTIDKYNKVKDNVESTEQKITNIKNKLKTNKENDKL